MPRQTGKTTLIRSVGTYRCLVCQRDVFYTAQTGKDARERWMDLVKLLRVNDALKDHVRVGLRGGSEQITFRERAAFRVFAPTPESLHGYTPPTVMIDEAFALAAQAGELLMGAIGPAQITIVDKQIWIVSTMGTAESTFLHDWIDRALGGMARVALFLWGAGDGDDPYTPDGVASFHPGIGFPLNGKTLTPADVLEQIERNTRAEYERAYANRRTVTASHLIPVDEWNALRDDDPTPPADPSAVTLSYDVGLDRKSSTIVAAWQGVDDRPRVRVVRSGPGASWLADAVVELRSAWSPRAVAAVGHGPVLEVTAELRARGEHVVELGERDFAAATGAFLGGINERGGRDAFYHHGGDLLDRSVTGLVTRAGAVDGVSFSRRHSVGDSSAGIAAAAALYVHRQESIGGAPVFRTPGERIPDPRDNLASVWRDVVAAREQDDYSAADDAPVVRGF